MTKKLQNKISIIKNYDDEATLELRKLLNNDNVRVHITKGYANMYFMDADLLSANIKDDGKIRYYHTHMLMIDNDTDIKDIELYIDYLNLIRQIMMKQTASKVVKILEKYIKKTTEEINKLNIA